MKGTVASIARSLGLVLMVVSAGVGLLASSQSLAELDADVYLAANICLFVAVLTNNAAGGARFMLAFYFLFIVAVPVRVQIATGIFPIASAYSSAQLLSGFAIFSIGQLAFSAGESISVRRGPARRRQVAPMDPDFYRRAAVVAFVISLLVIYAVGPSDLLVARADRSDTLTGQTVGVSQQLQYIGRSISLVGVLVCFYLLLKDKATRHTPSFLLLTASSLVVFALLHYPPALSRFELLGTAIAVLAVTVTLFSMRIKWVLAVVAPFFLYLFFPLIKQIGLGASSARGFGGNVENYLTSVDFDSFKQVVDTSIYLQQDNSSYRFGVNFVGALLFFVPRSIWHAKPVDSGQIVSEGLGYRYNNVANPLVSEGLISFGLLGTFVALLVVGLLVGRLERQARQGQLGGVLRREVIGYALLSGFLVILLRGSLNGTAPAFGSAFIFYIIVSAWQNGITHSRKRWRTDLIVDNDDRLYDYRRAKGVDVVAAPRAARAAAHLHARR